VEGKLLFVLLCGVLGTAPRYVTARFDEGLQKTDKSKSNSKQYIWNTYIHKHVQTYKIIKILNRSKLKYKQNIPFRTLCYSAITTKASCARATNLKQIIKKK
jgi:hypothetical protein